MRNETTNEKKNIVCLCHFDVVCQYILICCLVFFLSCSLDLIQRMEGAMIVLSVEYDVIRAEKIFEETFLCFRQLHSI